MYLSFTLSLEVCCITRRFVYRRPAFEYSHTVIGYILTTQSGELDILGI